MIGPVRTPERPMAFTADEFWRGAWTAWAVFTALLLGWMVVLALAMGAGVVAAYIIWFVVYIVLYGGLLGGGVALLAMLVLSPIAWLIGRCMRRVTARWVHATVFSAFGAIVGGATLSIFSAVGPGLTAGYPLDPWPWAMVTISAAAVGIGWWRASQYALDRDVFEPHFPAPDAGPADRRIDPDAAFEDRALDR